MTMQALIFLIGCALGGIGLGMIFYGDPNEIGPGATVLGVSATLVIAALTVIPPG